MDAVKQLNGLPVPAFAVYDLNDSKGRCDAYINEDGSLTGDFHDLPAGSVTATHRAGWRTAAPASWFLRWLMPRVGNAFAVASCAVGFFAHGYIGTTLTLGAAACVSWVLWGVSHLDDDTAPPRVFREHRFSGIIPAESREIAKTVAAALGPDKDREGFIHFASVDGREFVRKSREQAADRRILEPWLGWDPYRGSRQSFRVLLVEEAHAWTFAKAPRNLDPLLILEIGGAWFLLDKFDVTTAEAWVANEGRM